MSKTKKICLLITGGENFTNVGFVTAVLEHLHNLTNGNVGQVHYTGVPGAVEEWVDSKCITLKLYDLEPLQKLKSIPDMVELPEYVKNVDRYYLKGRTLIQKLKIDLVVAFPAEDGNLSPNAWDMVQFAKFAKVNYLDCTHLLEIVRNY